MDRNKSSSSSSRNAKSKITQYPPDIFALGSKPSSSRDNESKRSSSSHKSSSSSSSSKGGSSERKRDHSSSSIPAVAPLKKSKTGSSVIRAVNVPSTVPSSSITPDRTPANTQPQPTVEFWETLAVESDPVDLIPNIMRAWDNKDQDKIVSYLCGSVKQLRSQRYKQDKILFYSLINLAKLRPSLFATDHVVNALASLLRREPTPATHSFNKTNRNSAVPILCANLLLKGHLTKSNWPDLFVRLYVDDALGDRIWVDHEDCKAFVDNIITAFNTRIPPKSLLTPELSGSLTSTRDTSSPIPVAGDDDMTGRNTPEVLSFSGDGKDNTDVPVHPRYLQSYVIAEQIVLEAIKEQLARSRQPEAVTRNFLRLLSSTCGLVEIRIIAVSRLEMWLHNSKLARPAQELLAYLCINCASVTPRDMEVTAHLTKIRLKSKALANIYLNCLRELISVHPDNLPIMLKHTIYNELSNSRNPNNMPMIAVMFQAAPEIAANVLAEIFQELLINKDDFLRSLRTLLREIVRVLRYDINIYAFCRSLVRERKDLAATIRDFEFRDRIFLAIADLLCLCMFLGISPQVKEAAQLLIRGDKKELGVLQTYQLLVAKIQQDALTWLHEVVLRVYRPQVQDFGYTLRKILLLEPGEQYYKLDNWPGESDRNLLLRLASEVPLLQTTLIRVLLIGISKEHPLNAADTLEIADQLIKRAALLPNDQYPPLQTDKLDIIDFIFNLSAYHHPENISLPPGYTPPQLAISNHYWKGWIMILMLSAHNPSTFGNLAWKKYPMLRTLMEMCITNHFAYPPPTVAAGEVFDELKNKEIQACALERQLILEFESHLAAASSKIAITEQNSLLISQLIEMKPGGDSRHPPQLVLDQLHTLNATHRMGHLLCRSRHPDFLLDIIQRQGSSQHMPWLADLVHNSDGALSHLPVQCLCEYLLISGMNQNSEKNEKHKKHSQVLAHLQTVLTDPAQELNAAYEILEYFLRRLSSLHCASRLQAIKGLQMVLQTVVVLEEEPMEEDNADVTDLADYWLLKQIPVLPHFHSIRPLIVTSLRQACQFETNPLHISSYINFLAQQTINDSLSEMLDLVLDMSQLIVERSTIIAAVLPLYEQENRASLNTLHSLMVMFCTYLTKSKDKQTYEYGETSDQVLIKWASGIECTMHILVVHAMIILLTYGPANRQDLFDSLLETWFPSDEQLPKAFLVDTSEEALLIPDWLKLRMIRSTVPQLVDAALVNLEPSQLVLFIQSFGIPVFSMSKLLSMLDMAVTVDPVSVGEAVLDKCYMAQLVEVQHKRGATGGSTFVQVLQLQEPQIPDDINIETDSTRQQLPQIFTKSQSHELPEPNTTVLLLNAIFLNHNFEGNIDKEFRKLLRHLAQEIHSPNTSSKIYLQVVLSYLRESVQSEELILAFITKESYSTLLLRLILSNNIYPTELATFCKTLLPRIADKKSSLAIILTNHVQKQQKTAGNPEKNVNLNEPTDVLENIKLDLLERKTKLLVNKSLKTSETLNLVNVMSKLLLSDVENKRIERTGLFIDWIAELELEIIGSEQNVHMKLLFSKNPSSTSIPVITNTNRPSWMSFRPYLLTLLTHRVSWRALHSCVVHVLSICSQEYDPAAILDFLWALICNPKLWQGKDKYEPKNYSTEDVLQLETKQIIVLVDYILEEALEANQVEPFCNKNSVHKIEQRLPLLLQCLGENQEAIRSVVNHLIVVMNSSTEEIVHDTCAMEIINLEDSFTEKEPQGKSKQHIVEEFIVLLYMRIPKIVQYISKRDRTNMKNVSKITGYSTSVIDNITHNLFSALASTPRSKDWPKKSQEFEFLARKMVAVHPYLILRQLPMIAATLKGRVHLEFIVFKLRNHLNLFVQILGMIELLQPIIFEEEYRAGFESVLMSYFGLFKYHGQIKEIHSILGKFVCLLQNYVSHDSTAALRYIQQHAVLLNELHIYYSNWRPLRDLISNITLPENPLAETSGEQDEVLVTIARPPSPEPAPPNWNNLVQNIGKSQDEELPSILQEIEHISNRRPAILESIIDQIAPLILSGSTTVRSLGHLLLLRYLKYNSKSVTASSPILSAVLQALESPNAEVISNLLEKLSDYVIALQEHAARILRIAFVLGVKSNISTTSNISKAMSVLNIQSGC